MILLLIAAVAAPPPTPPSSISLQRVEARLFYEEIGRLSDDLLARGKPFEGWNTIIGEGGAEEAANDMLVTVRLEANSRATKPQMYVTAPVEVIIRNSRGKTLTSRTWSSFLTSGKGVIVLPLWVRNVGCAGHLAITARYNGASKVGHLDFACGE